MVTVEQPIAQHAQREARTRWRRLAQDEETPRLAAQAQQDAVTARASLERLTERCRPLAWHIARTYVAAEADAADIVQDALLQMAQHIHQLRCPEAFSHWFAALTHNAARQWLRRERAHRQAYSLDDEAIFPGERAGLHDPHAGDAIHQVETTDTIDRLLPILSDREREALQRRYLAEHTQREIGRALGISSRAVEGLIYRSVHRLRTVLTQCTSEIAELESWCSVCASHRLQGRIQPGNSPSYPLRLQATCPSCSPGDYFWISLPLPLQHYDSLDTALQRGGDVLNDRACRLLGDPTPSCRRCQAPLRHHRFWDRYGYEVQWQCPNCHDAGMQTGAHVAASKLPAWQRFWQSSQQLRTESQDVLQQGGERRLLVCLRDLASGRRATLALAFDDLQVRRLEVSER